jgi:hypothetical protein
MLFSQWWETRGVPRSTAFRLIRLAKDLRPHKTRVPQSRSPVNYLTAEQVEALDGLVARMNRGTPMTRLSIEDRFKSVATEAPLDQTNEAADVVSVDPIASDADFLQHLTSIYEGTGRLVHACWELEQKCHDALTADALQNWSDKLDEAGGLVDRLAKVLMTDKLQGLVQSDLIDEALRTVAGWRSDLSYQQDTLQRWLNRFRSYQATQRPISFCLVEPVSRRVPIPIRLRFDILSRDGYCCQACGAKAADGAELHIDHIHPVSKGGTNDPVNLQALCRDCNLGKGARVL